MNEEEIERRKFQLDLHIGQFVQSFLITFSAIFFSAFISLLIASLMTGNIYFLPLLFLYGLFAVIIAIILYVLSFRSFTKITELYINPLDTNKVEPISIEGELQTNSKEGSIMSDRPRFLSILVAFFLIGILIGYIIHAVQIYQLQVEWINVISSLILTIITGMFIIQNKNTLTEMIKARKTESLPNISANLGYPGPLSINLIIINTGKGPAYEVDVNYGFEPFEGPYKNWLQPLLSPEEKYTFLLKPHNFDEVAKKYDFLIVKGTCKDIFGQEHEINEKIDLKEINKGYHDATILYPDTIERRLGRIASEIKKIERKI